MANKKTIYEKFKIHIHLSGNEKAHIVEKLKECETTSEGIEILKNEGWYLSDNLIEKLKK